MVYTPTENRLGIQPIAQSNGALPSQYQTGQSQLFGQAHALGTIIRADDPTFGEGEFIYLVGVGSTVVGSLVTYDPFNNTTTLATNTTKQGNPVAVAMSANNATTTYGWYQIAGAAVIKKNATKINPAVKIATSSTSGRIQGGSVAGQAVFNAITLNAATVASATSTVTVLIQRPFLEPIAT